ncbi:uncharacterized protein AB675_1126 [Cyphellophora attinorum]|uniref:Uncharacterized protein n=1 Tax=Cyphellophora attinorum TaxID=1664694 RepID=A0A0N0NKG9_9EURO|nr:uncharacterized protein AB675_1126 [Phialophora attinorum]KPI38028.1 hypothetical protein AB675_1126 [Phialophora attinorum]
MVSTRSKTGGASEPKQATLEEFDVKPAANAPAHQPPTPPPKESIPSDKPEEENRPRKVPKGSTPSDPVGAARRAAETRRKDPRGGAPEAQSKGKRNAANGTKKEDDASEKANERSTSKPIMINRAPVLTLWAACVACFLYPDLNWEACLSAGAAIATLCAISKGRAVGKMDPPNDDNDNKAKKKEKREKDRDDAPQNLDVMSFALPLNPKDGGRSVMMSGKPKPQSESALISKYGGKEAYSSARKAMEEGLKAWRDDEDELNRRAFGMYEKFRPGVPSGSQGWGRKGELDLEKIAQVVGKN